MLILFLLPQSAVAQEPDRIDLKNGERLLGTIVGIDSGDLLLKSPLVSDTVRIPSSDLRTLRSSQPFWIELSGGERLRGTLENATDTFLEIRSSRLGTVRSSWKSIVSLQRDTATTPSARTTENKPGEAKSPPSIMPPLVHGQIDRIEFTDGDHISGTLLKMESGRLTIKTPYADSLGVAFRSIRRIQTHAPVTIELKNGERWIGRLIWLPEGKQALFSEASGQAQPLDWKRVRAINPDDQHWSLSLGLKGAFREGNKDRFDSRVDFDLRRKTEKDEFRIRFLFNIAEEEGVRTARNWFSQLKYDYHFAPRTYAFLSSQMKEDEFKKLDLRTANSVGFGYRALDLGTFTNDLEIGLTHIFEDFKNEDDMRMAVRLASNSHWKINAHTALNNQLVVFPSLEGSEYQLRNEMSLKVNLYSGLNLNLSFILEYDSDALTGTRKTDVHGLAGISYKIRF
ncbi:MAG: DUF481 domain-containing protein [Planctomycetota bacterium]|jgi:putative salt-induced outer membrane protein YdiY|nr:DUF481 domain-containing protein [Planctomycetota bacterium]